MNRKPMYQELKNLLVDFKIELSEIDKQKSWFAILFTHHKTQKVFKSESIKCNQETPKIVSLLAYYRFTDSDNHIELFGLL